MIGGTKNKVKKLLYVGMFALAVAGGVREAKGYTVTQLTYEPSYEGQPSWSPDGSKIAFVSDRDGNYEIYVVDSNGSNQERLTYTPYRYDIGPDWSPDGNKIVFSAGEYDSNIFVMNADGSDEIRLTTGLLNEAPTWRYNDKILYHDWSGTIYMMNPDGNEKTALAEGSYPSWSADANKILFSWMGDIWTMNPDGSNKMLLYDESSGPWVFEPACSPKKNKVAFSIGGTLCTASIPPWCEHFSDLYMMNSDGINLERLTFDNGDWCYDPHPPWPTPLHPKPTWFTDGTKIAYHYKGDIWVMSGFPALSADLYPDGIVNLFDFGVLADRWRQDDPLADIAPDSGDDIVDFLDLAKLCEKWLQTEE